MGEDLIDLVLQSFDAHQEEAIEKLRQLICFPTISAEYPSRKEDFLKCCAWLEQELSNLGMENTAVIPLENAPPLIYAEWLGAGDAAPTILIYGHYDVVSVDPLESWSFAPFESIVCENRIYGRGASDDKGQFWAILCAIGAYLKGGERCPVNIKVLLEGEEEILSPHLSQFLREAQHRLRCSGILIADMDALHPQIPLIMYGTRGNCTLEVSLQGPARELHSGTYGGGVENPLNVLVRLLATIQDGETRRILIPGFYDAVRPISQREMSFLEDLPISDEMGLALTGAPALAGEEGYPLKARISFRPTFEVHGICGGYCGEGVKTVIPSRVTAKLSFRLVPDQDPIEIGRLIQDYLRRQVPPTVTIDISCCGMAYPTTIDIETPLIAAGQRAILRGFGAPPRFVRGGGSIPILNIFQEIINPHIFLTGFGLPEDGAHSPNESFSLLQFRNGVHSMIALFDELGRFSS